METEVETHHGQDVPVDIALVEAVLVQDILAGVEARQVCALLEAG